MHSSVGTINAIFAQPKTELTQYFHDNKQIRFNSIGLIKSVGPEWARLFIAIRYNNKTDKGHRRGELNRGSKAVRKLLKRG